MTEKHVDPRPGDGLAGQRVVVTGATGFIGRRLIDALLKLGCDVTALLRTRHGAAALEQAGAKALVCPLHPGPALTQALDGAAALFHLAYDFRAPGADNLAAFDALAKAAEDGSCNRIVHLSSAVVYDSWPNGPITERNPITPEDVQSYRGAKIAMEQRLLQGKCDAAILQPTIVYGPGSALWTNGPLAMMRRGGIILPDPPGQCPAVHVDDVVQAALRAASSPRIGVERYLISGPDMLGWKTFFEGYARLAGCGEVRIDPAANPAPPPSPNGNAPSGPSLAGQLSAHLRRLVGRRRVEAAANWARSVQARLAKPRPVMPDMAGRRLFAGQPEVSTRYAQDQIGYVPRVSFDEWIEHMRKQSAR
ncbi:NAD-dependent epimerase/dehydratase family protein [Ruegeria atlantica]|uniref:NAD-dependent epimerase/dehydratase family protein n=1 Tax=Ruegeria atlantica TaxID=81569 RepID=A0AA91C0U6_9RHOB|nr:NAD-dependent epimerase/dehydratase family protein [Ruegeria atlantica]NOE20681.1 NAD-dependent epimerase/dehydratase family protein [Ruegeria atlantica]